MAIVTIDHREYELDSLSNEARSQIDSILLCDRKLSEIQAESAIVQTARNAYLAALYELLPKKTFN